MLMRLKIWRIFSSLHLSPSSIQSLLVPSFRRRDSWIFTTYTIRRRSSSDRTISGRSSLVSWLDRFQMSIWWWRGMLKGIFVRIFYYLLTQLFETKETTIFSLLYTLTLSFLLSFAVSILDIFCWHKHGCTPEK